MYNQDDESADSYGTLLSAASTITMETMDESTKFDTCPLDQETSFPSYAQVLTGPPLVSSPASTITQSIQQQTNIGQGYDSGFGYGHGYNTRWEEENRQLQQRLSDQDARLKELDQAKLDLDQRLEKILEEVHNKECRTKELENTIANLLSVVSDRDQQMAERDQQFELRNRQFDSLMARLAIEYPSDASTTPSAHQQHGELLNMPETPARSNKRQNTLHTPNRGDTRMDQDNDDTMNALTESFSPILR